MKTVDSFPHRTAIPQRQIMAKYSVDFSVKKIRKAQLKSTNICVKLYTPSFLKSILSHPNYRITLHHNCICILYHEESKLYISLLHTFQLYLSLLNLYYSCTKIPFWNICANLSCTISSFLYFCANLSCTILCFNIIRGGFPLRFDYADETSTRRHLENLYKNIIYNELLTRGYNVFTGKTFKGEIDFVAIKDGKKCFIQVSYLLFWTCPFSRIWQDISERIPT